MVSVSGMCKKLVGFLRVLAHIRRSFKDRSSRTREQTREKPKTSAIPPIFALTIGIDLYENSTIEGLRGCVADADDVVDFLVNTLNVPPAHITRLRNKQATVENITSALEALATDPRIPKDANSIFIFYAGHGSEALAPDGWDTSGNIQTLLPHDFDPGSDVHPLTRNGLADMKLSRLLEHIANEKGNNITVILDSCHAGSGTRDFGSVDRKARGVRLYGRRLGTDALPSSPESVVVDQGIVRFQGLESHVLLSACNPVQQAYELDGRGAFTAALMKLLRSTNLEKLSYTDIIRRLPLIHDQNPQCEGINQRRIFLRHRLAEHHRISFKVSQPRKGVYAIDAGEKDGITATAEFVVYESMALDNKLGCLVVDVVHESECLLRSVEGDNPFDVPDAGAFAILARIGTTKDVRLFIDFPDEISHAFTSLLGKAQRFLDFDPSFLKVVDEREEDPDIIITPSGNDHTQIRITDKICRKFGLEELPHRLPRDGKALERVLRGVNHFYRELRRTTNGRHLLSSKIRCECYELGDFGDGMQRAIGTDLLKDKMLYLEIGAAPKTYGFRIDNTSQVPLFVSVFYFSMSDFRIDAWYEPPFAARNGQFPPLQPNGFLTIGYGSGGVPSRKFGLDDGRNVDVGYLKLFLSTEHVDYSRVQQESPFRQDRATTVYKPKLRVWDTMLIPIVLLRKR